MLKRARNFAKMPTAEIVLDICSAHDSTLKQFLIDLPYEQDDLADYSDSLPLALALCDVL